MLDTKAPPAARIGAATAILATADKGFLFIPALAADSGGSSALPPFAKLSQGVRDPLGNGGELAKLLKAVLKSDWETSPSIQRATAMFALAARS